MKDAIFHKFYEDTTIIDRKTLKNEAGVDVIIPILNTNELFEANLCSFYREIQINKLLIGDGGCTDDSIDIVNQFPRVTVYNQKELKTLGYRIRKLIEEVSTDWFIYLHADVFLPEGWYDEMIMHRKQYDWYECYRKMTILFEYWAEKQNKAERSYSGSQMGRTEAFKNVLPKIEDDHLYRNEDIIFSELIKAEGFKYGRVAGTFHYHQIMNRRGEKEPKLKKVAIEKEADIGWEIQTSRMQLKGIVKYLQPKKYLIKGVNAQIALLLQHNALDWRDFKEWVRRTNPAWLDKISKKSYYVRVVVKTIKKLLKKF